VVPPALSGICAVSPVAEPPPSHVQLIVVIELSTMPTVTVVDSAGTGTSSRPFAHSGRAYWLIW